jgi:hypothetical protein
MNSEVIKNYKTYVSRLYAIRDILAFRYDIIRRLDHDFNNNAYLKYLNQKDLAERLSQPKTATHTPEEDRKTICNRIIHLCSSKYDVPINQEHKALMALSLKFAADSLISKLAFDNVIEEFSAREMSEDEPVLHRDKLRRTTIELNEKLISILNEISYVRSKPVNVRVEFLDKDLNKIMSNMLKQEDHYLLLFIVALCQNAVKHGLKEKDKADSYFVSVKISVSNNKIRIENSIQPQKDENAQKPKDNSTNNRFSSLITIKKYYSAKFENQKILAQPTSFIYDEDKNKSLFFVELPIITLK